MFNREIDMSPLSRDGAKKGSLAGAAEKALLPSRSKSAMGQF